MQVKAVKLLRRVEGQWYVVCGELLGPEDDPEALAEALCLSRAGQAELAALARGWGPDSGSLHK